MIGKTFLPSPRYNAAYAGLKWSPVCRWIAAAAPFVEECNAEPVEEVNP